MIVGTGIDVAEVQRVTNAIARFGDHFLRSVFTERELQHCNASRNRDQRYAAHFAAKEATMKALGTGWDQGVQWCDIEVEHEAGGRPTITLHGEAARAAADLSAKRIFVSVVQAADRAVAQVILEA
jgi:holo-[acyl-carrier protein] synthase